MNNGFYSQPDFAAVKKIALTFISCLRGAYGALTNYIFSSTNTWSPQRHTTDALLCVKYLRITLSSGIVRSPSRSSGLASKLYTIVLTPSAMTEENTPGSYPILSL